MPSAPQSRTSSFLINILKVTPRTQKQEITIMLCYRMSRADGKNKGVIAPGGSLLQQVNSNMKSFNLFCYT